MKVLAICGSPRKGNSEFLLNVILKECERYGAQIELILLREKNIQFCKGCDEICSNNGKCVIEDDMKEIIEKLANADAIIFATPTYFDNISAIFKNFMDRTDPLTAERKLAGKSVGLVVVGGYLDSAKICAEKLNRFAENNHKMITKGIVCTKAYKPEEVAENKEIIEECKKLAEKICK